MFLSFSSKVELIHKCQFTLPIAEAVILRFWRFYIFKFMVFNFLGSRFNRTPPA